MATRTSVGWTNASLLFARIALGLYFALAGYNKIVGAGVGNFVAGNIGQVPSFVPRVLGEAYLYGLPFVEFVVGAGLVLGILTRLQATLAAMMLVSFLMAVMKPAYVANVVGANPGPPFDANFILLSLSLLLIGTGPGTLSLDLTLRRKPAAEAARA